MTAKKSARGNAVKQRVGIPTTEKMFMIRKTYPGTSYGQIPHERGRLIRLQNSQNDEIMLRTGYIEEIINPGAVSLSECGQCGGEFIDMAYRDAHFKRAHKDVLRAREQTVHELTESQRQTLLANTQKFGPSDMGFSPAATPEEIENERIIQREEEIAPLHMDKTKASREA